MMLAIRESRAKQAALRQEVLQKQLEQLQQRQQNGQQEIMESIQTQLTQLGGVFLHAQRNAAADQNQNLTVISNTLTQQLSGLETRFQTLEMTSEQKLDNLRRTMEAQLTAIQQKNQQKLEELRVTVDEKLQQMLQDRLSHSFQLVSDQLEQVYKGLGEMQTLAVSVGDLKKVLSNVKTRGMVGEIQLGAILEDILTQDQYERNVAVNPQSKCVVEFAVRLPSQGQQPIYLPIDAKFPSDAYYQLQQAYDSADAHQVQKAAQALTQRLRQFARDIHDKYIAPPATTDFAILFLPFEGLYAEAVNRGLIESLQRDFHVMLAGPSTMAALLNSLQLGLKTLTIQRRSSEVWAILAAVKTEFGKFAAGLQQTQLRLNQAHDELERLVTTRTRMIQRSLKSVEEIDPVQAADLLKTANPPQEGHLSELTD